jgi:serine/threonine protein phosphatase PrpC
MERANHAAAALEQELRRVPPLPAPVTPQVGGPTIPDRADGSGITTEPGMVARTERGLGNPHNRDAATIARRPDGSAFAVVTDGLTSGRASADAARNAARAAHTELVNALSRGATPSEATRSALVQAGLAVAGLGRIGEDAPPATTYLSALVVPTPAGTEIRLTWVGDTRAYWIPAAGGPATLLTTDHANAGALTQWLAATTQANPGEKTVTQTEPGLLVLATDGLWRPVPDPAAVLSDPARTDPARAAEELLTEARIHGGADDTTVTIIAIPPPPASGAP